MLISAILIPSHVCSLITTHVKIQTKFGGDKDIRKENYSEWVKVFRARISTLLSILLDNLQTGFFKISKDNARFELESDILVHFTLGQISSCCACIDLVIVLDFIPKKGGDGVPLLLIAAKTLDLSLQSGLQG